MSDDTINGGTGNDTIFAGIGDDLVFGGLGDDLIFDGAGNDTVHGDDDDDTFWLASGSNDGSDYLEGGLGIDTLVEDLSAETASSFSVAQWPALCCRNTGRRRRHLGRYREFHADR